MHAFKFSPSGSKIVVPFQFAKNIIGSINSIWWSSNGTIDQGKEIII